MQSCCETVIAAYKKTNADEWRIKLLEKYLTPELIMAIGTTESGWYYGGDYNIGITKTYTGITGDGALWIHKMTGATGASQQVYDYVNIYCSIAGTTCSIAHDIVYAGNDGVGMGNKKYDGDDDQQLLYDALYAYGAGSQYNYNRSETRISTAYKLYAFQEFCKVRGKEWKNWNKDSIDDYCDNVTIFTWTENVPTESSRFKLPENSKSKPTGEEFSE